jgi:uncharacterized RDD family membrane protein YckC
MKESFHTSAGTVEILFDEQSRVVSAYRFDADGRPVSAVIENWDHVDLADILTRQAGVPAGEASEIAATVTRYLGIPRPRSVEEWQPSAIRRAWDHESGPVENAGVPLRFVAVLLDAVIVLFPMGIVVGLLSGGGYAESGDGYANAGINIGDNAFWLLLVLGIAYYVVCEAATGATLGKRMVGIHVVEEDGTHVTLGAAVVRNVVRLVDCLFFYLIGVIFALTSPRGQRLGDRAAHTLVVRR